MSHLYCFAIASGEAQKERQVANGLIPRRALVKEALLKLAQKETEITVGQESAQDAGMIIPS